MTPRYCIVIPHYRHHRPLAQLLPKLAEHEIPIYVVDDASGGESQAALEELVERCVATSLIQREHNGGKGAAMMTGLRTAAAAGFSHAISLDADGQHAPQDVAKLHELSLAHPDALFSGRPLFGKDIPASRLYGRMLTNGLVRLVTGSSMIKDAMCGLRVYPLQHILPLCDQLGYRTRMEFDVEILVRACWQGLDIRSLDTQVVYPEDGESHFNLLADNLRLIVMHILLICGGLRRLPGRLWRGRRVSGEAGG